MNEQRMMDKHVTTEAINQKKKAPGSWGSFQRTVFVLFVFILGVLTFWLFSDFYGHDWHATFFPVAQNVWQPYTIKSFVNPPWTAWMLYPFGLLPERISLAINASLNIVVFGYLIIKRGGGPWALFLGLTSAPFFSLLLNGGIEWIPALGFILADEWGVVLLITKPQSGILAIVPWIYDARNKLKFILPGLAILIMSFLVWGNWLDDIDSNLNYLKGQYGMGWNISLFPWTIPLGLVLLIYVFKYRPAKSELLCILATLCLAPYFAVHSMVIFFALLSAYYRRTATAAWVLLWIYPFLRSM